MATIADFASVFNCPNYVGVLHMTGGQSAAFISILGSMTPGGGRAIEAIEYSFSTHALPSASDPDRLEGADAPTASTYTREQTKNVTQIWQEVYGATYSRNAAPLQMAADNSQGGGPVVITNEVAQQRVAQVKHFMNSANSTLLNGTFANPADATSTARKTRGALAATVSNVIDAQGAALSKNIINQLLDTMWAAGALGDPDSTFIFVGSRQKMRISSLYNNPPPDRRVGGVNIGTVVTDFGDLNVVMDKHMPAGQLAIFDFSVMSLVFSLIRDPDTNALKGVFFSEPLAKTGSSHRFQVYAEFGLDHGPEVFHGKATNLNTDVV